MIADYHMHLRAARADGEEIDHTPEAVERYVEVAAARGVDEIGFSEHVYYFEQTRRLWNVQYQLERCAYDLDVYVDAVLEAKRRGLPVKLGLEVDYVGARQHELAEILAPYPWDFLLGSVHWIDGLAVDQLPGLWGAHGVEGVWRRYFDALAELAESRTVDVLAHPDLPKIFGTRPAPEVLDALHECAATAVARAGVCVEVSAAGLRKPVGEIYPDRSLLRRCRALGVPITLASDAHVADDVGRDLERAIEHAREAGYETIAVFDRRRRRKERFAGGHLGGPAYEAAPTSSPRRS